jgi:hypothetical protein
MIIYELYITYEPDIIYDGSWTTYKLYIVYKLYVVHDPSYVIINYM